jgi:hypothetical protein
LILVAHQPEYIPYLGFFAKVSLCDLFLVSDHLQYAEKDFQNRNYVKGQNGRTLLTVPVALGGRWDQPINEVPVDNNSRWGKKHWMSIYHGYHRAPHFGLYAPTLEEVYSKRWERLCDLNLTLLRHMLGWLSIDVKVELTSAYDLKETKTNLLIEMCEKTGADTFISGRGARDYAEVFRFEERGLRHYFFDFVHPEYEQRGGPFVANLSALDLLFNLGPRAKDVVRKAASTSPLSAA